MAEANSAHSHWSATRYPSRASADSSMNLSTRNLNVLSDLKRELLSRELVSQETIAPQEPGVGEKGAARPRHSPRDGNSKSHIMRHARQRGMSYQRYKQRQGW